MPPAAALVLALRLGQVAPAVQAVVAVGEEQGSPGSVLPLRQPDGQRGIPGAGLHCTVHAGHGRRPAPEVTQATDEQYFAAPGWAVRSPPYRNFYHACHKHVQTLILMIARR